MPVETPEPPEARPVPRSPPSLSEGYTKKLRPKGNLSPIYRDDTIGGATSGTGTGGHGLAAVVLTSGHHSSVTGTGPATFHCPPRSIRDVGAGGKKGKSLDLKPSVASTMTSHHQGGGGGKGLAAHTAHAAQTHNGPSAARALQDLHDNNSPPMVTRALKGRKAAPQPAAKQSLPPPQPQPFEILGWDDSSIGPSPVPPDAVMLRVQRATKGGHPPARSGVAGAGGGGGVISGTRRTGGGGGLAMTTHNTSAAEDGPQVFSSRGVPPPPGSVSPQMRQWEFKIPKAVDTSVASDDDDGAKSSRQVPASIVAPPPPAPSHTAFAPPMRAHHHRQSVSLGANNRPHLPRDGQAGPAGGPAKAAARYAAQGVSKTRSLNRPARAGNAWVAPATGAQLDELLVAGHQRPGGYNDDTATSYALAVLEDAVAKERRLREELAAARRQIAVTMRGLVRTFQEAAAARAAEESEAAQAAAAATTSAAASKFGGVLVPAAARRGPSCSVPLAKCSVVVHTLATTIQQYARQRQSAALAALLAAGPGDEFTERTLASRAAEAGIMPLDTASLRSPDRDGSPSTGRPVSTALSEAPHEEVLDSTTIAQLKQLYFAYYDCEAYVLGDGPDEGHSPSAKRLTAGGSARGIRNVIEEANVLVEGYDTADEKPTGGTSQGSGMGGASGTGGAGAGTGGGSSDEPLPPAVTNTSMLFDEEREWRQIYSDDDDGSSVASSSSLRRAHDDNDETAPNDDASW